MDKLRNVLGLLDSGKRIYQLKDGEVSRADFEYCSVINQILFGEKGLVETLGPTWSMVHDPRFDALERLWVVEKPSMFGGDSRTGVQRQLSDGTFTNSMAALEQYSEMLGEGRYMMKVLRARAIIEAIAERFPEKQLRINERDPLGALALVAPYTPGIRAKLAETNTIDTPDTAARASDEELAASASIMNPAVFAELGILSPEEKQIVIREADSYERYKPHSLRYWPDDELKKLLFAEYTNYFNRKGQPNQLALTLLALFKADLVGLVADYAEVANVQETVLLEDTNELYEPEKHGEEAPRVSMEIENLERALTYRAELRTTAYRILNQLGITNQLVELTDTERDQLLKVIYSSDFLGDRTTTVTRILSFLAGIRLTGATLEQREALQIATATADAQQYVAALKDGSIQPISRDTEGTVETVLTPEEEMIQRVLQNPIAAYVFTRLHNIELRLDVACEEFAPMKPEIDPVTGERLPEDAARYGLMRMWIVAAIDPDYVVVTNVKYSDEDKAKMYTIQNLVKAQRILRRVFEDADFVWTDEEAARLLTEVEFLDPSEELKVAELPEGSDPGQQQATPELIN